MSPLSDHAEGRQILVNIRRPGDVEPARALIRSQARSFRFFLLFADEELLDLFGDISIEHSVDTYGCMLNPELFSAVISFAGPRASSGAQDLIFLSFFNRVGVSTVEVQRTLFQDGLPPLAERPLKDLSAGARAQASLRSSYEAKDILAWGGDDGIGYLMSDLVPADEGQNAQDFVLISSGLDWDGYGDKERYQFAIAVLRLAAEHPETRFVWRPSLEEQSHRDGAPILALVEEYELPNLTLEKEESIVALMLRCRAGIAMPSTALLDFAICRKPVFTFVCDATVGLLPIAASLTFRNYFELEAAWPSLETHARVGGDSSSLAGLNHERLYNRLQHAVQATKLSDDFSPVALKSIAAMRDEQMLRSELRQISDAVASINKRLGALEKRSAEIERTVGKLPTRLAKLAERVGVLQRSTLAYKALRLLSGRRAPGTGSPKDG